MEIIQANPDEAWYWDYISMNPNITMEIIGANHGKPWNWYWISRNPNITMEFIEKNLSKIIFTSLSCNKFTKIRFNKPTKSAGKN